jgi:hypothetical protein
MLRKLIYFFVVVFFIYFILFFYFFCFCSDLQCEAERTGPIEVRLDNRNEQEEGPQQQDSPQEIPPKGH